MKNIKNDFQKLPFSSKILVYNTMTQLIENDLLTCCYCNTIDNKLLIIKANDNFNKTISKF